MTFNKLILAGRLTADPESKQLQNGMTVVNFRIAVGRSKKNQQTGQWENDPNPLYLDCTCFDQADSRRKLGKVVMDYVKKGDPIFVEGRLQFEQWDDKQSGQKRSKHKMVVDTVELLGSKSDNGGGGGNSQQATNSDSNYGGGNDYPTPTDTPGVVGGSGGEIPF